jgi:hypothetical protein
MGAAIQAGLHMTISPHQALARDLQAALMMIFLFK